MSAPENPRAFPHTGSFGPGTDAKQGMTLRDWFAGQAPQPSDDAIALEQSRDHNRNPYNDAHKPRQRERIEIVAFLRYQYADAMLAARTPIEEKEA